ncbi:MAG: hypothetical protein ACKVIG_12150 [Flavobacteriales bacterium]
MELNGIYQKEVMHLYECTLIIENGILHRVNSKLLHSKPMELSHIQPENNSNFELHKMPSKSSLTPDANYKIEYKNEYNKIIRIYLKLSKWELFKLKWSKKDFYILKNDNWIKILITIIVALFLVFLKDIIFPKSK